MGRPSRHERQNQISRVERFAGAYSGLHCTAGHASAGRSRRRRAKPERACLPRCRHGVACKRLGRCRRRCVEEVVVVVGRRTPSRGKNIASAKRGAVSNSMHNARCREQRHAQCATGRNALWQHADGRLVPNLCINNV